MLLAITSYLLVLFTASLQLSRGNDSFRGTDLISKSNANVLDIETDRCTTILVGAKAGANGPMVNKFSIYFNIFNHFDFLRLPIPLIVLIVCRFFIFHKGIF